jgi:hypothetical protein
MHLRDADVYRRVGDGKIQIDVNSDVAGWDDHELYVQRVRNYTGKPIDIEVRRTYPGHVVFRSNLSPKLHDYQTVQFSAGVETGKHDLPFEVVRHQGRNAKQNNVALEQADVAR